MLLLSLDAIYEKSSDFYFPAKNINHKQLDDVVNVIYYTYFNFSGLKAPNLD